MVFSEDITNSINILKAGGIILYPTDTIWGLGCDATNQAAVDKIFTIKSRSENKSLLILVDGIGMAERYVKEIPEIAYELTSVSDSPLTIIYPNGKNLAAGICSEDGSVGIRICNDEFCSQLIGRFRKPLVSTSANFSGKPSPSNFGEIDKKLTESADYIVGYRQDDRRKFSSSPVIKVDLNGSVKIIRM
jgi:L-threonylcarbamoyladenylate synthase